MKRIIILQMVFLCAMAFPASAQDRYEFDVKPDEFVSQDITLKGNKNDQLKLKVKVGWKAQENRLSLTFDRKSVSENEAYLLFFPLLANKKPFKKVNDCKFQKNALWSKSVKAKTNPMSYFLKSNNLLIKDYQNCYLSLANNNEEEFSYEAKSFAEPFSVELTELFVARHQKRPWYKFSSRDKRLLFKAEPISLLIRPEKPAVVVDKCIQEEMTIAYINAHHSILSSNSAALKEAQAKRNCTYFDVLKETIRSVKNEVNQKCSKHLECDAIDVALKKYNLECDIILREECTPQTQTAAVCNLTENELMSINSMLKNLQMKINVKKKDGLSTADELREFQSIKNNVNPKITNECRRRFKNLIEAYTNYCTVIEGLF